MLGWIGSAIVRSWSLGIGSALSAPSAIAGATGAVTGVVVEPLTDTVVAQRIAGLVNGAFGERATSHQDEPQPAMSVRLRHRRVALDRASLAAAYPAAAGRVVVFVHGLVDTERSWFRRGVPVLATALTRELPCSSVFVRYNSGRHISDNGRELSDLLDTLVERWPVEVTEVVLIGHSMGGLVARSALHQGHDRARRWASLATELVCLGSPHGGAPLERLVASAAGALGGNPLAAPLARLLALRSDGIKDLAHGALHEQEWAERSTVDDGAAGAAAADAASTILPPGVRQLYVAATLARSPHGVLARLLGDLIVHPSSMRDAVQEADVRWLGGIDHFSLQRHADVCAAIVDWSTRKSHDEP